MFLWCMFSSHWRSIQWFNQQPQTCWMTSTDVKNSYVGCKKKYSFVFFFFVNACLHFPCWCLIARTDYMKSTRSIESTGLYCHRCCALTGCREELELLNNKIKTDAKLFQAKLKSGCHFLLSVDLKWLVSISVYPAAVTWNTFWCSKHVLYLTYGQSQSNWTITRLLYH